MVREDRAVEATVPIAATGSMEALVTPRWQLIVHEKRGAQLYDRTSDPKEAHDLAQTPEGSRRAVKSVEGIRNENEGSNEMKVTIFV